MGQILQNLSSGALESIDSPFPSAVCLSEDVNFSEFANDITNGVGADGVLICASTDSNDSVHQSAIACRQRGRVVLVGVTGLKLSRDDFYKKEISFQVSCPYGPGRYEYSYENEGLDPLSAMFAVQNRGILQQFCSLWKTIVCALKWLIFMKLAL